MREPTSIDECIYFTKRDSGKGKIKAWVFKDKCPKCNNALIGKPKDLKTGKPKIRAHEYECPSCGYKIDEKEYEDSLKVNIQYICPHCQNNGYTEVPFKRKKVQIFDEELQKKSTVDSLRFQCQKCNKNIDIVKKMKA